MKLQLYLKRNRQTSKTLSIPDTRAASSIPHSAVTSATDLINTPKLALLHILMLQNWSETGENKNWGHEYPTAPLIDVSTNEGGLNFSELSILDNFRVRRQILNSEEMNSDDLLNSLCSDFFLVLSQDRATWKRADQFYRQEIPDGANCYDYP